MEALATAALVQAIREAQEPRTLQVPHNFILVLPLFYFFVLVLSSAIRLSRYFGSNWCNWGKDFEEREAICLLFHNAVFGFCLYHSFALLLLFSDK